MLISAREATGILVAADLTREPARRLLLAGFAGAGHRTRGSLLYDEGRVRRLLDWRRVVVEHLDLVCRRGTFVARVGPRMPEASSVREWAGVDLDAPLDEQWDGVRWHWNVGPFMRLLLRERVARDGFVPFVATVSGFVAVGANLTALTPQGRVGERRTGAATLLELTEPGPWFAGFDGRRFPTGPGSHWLLWESPPNERLQQ